MPARSPELRRLIAAAGGAAKNGSPDAAVRKGDLAVARIEEYVARIVASAPSLTPVQRRRIAAILDATPDVAVGQVRTGDGLAAAAATAAEWAGGAA